MISGFLFRVLNQQLTQFLKLVQHRFDQESIISQEVVLENLSLFPSKSGVVRDRLMMTLGLIPGK